MPRLLAIGDIHGASKALNALLEVVKVRPEDTLVTLGDYVDRGPDTKGVLERLCDLQHTTDLIPLMGNHEAVMLAALDSPAALEDWLGIGGDAVLRSYNTSSLTGVPREHVDFLRSLRRWHETREHFFVHANAMDDVDLADQDDFILLWEPLYFAPSRHKSGKTMICGHTPQASGRPKNWGTAVCIDTGAGHGRWLTCTDVRNGHYWQADQRGVTREGELEPVFDEVADDGCWD